MTRSPSANSAIDVPRVVQRRLKLPASFLEFIVKPNDPRVLRAKLRVFDVIRAHPTFASDVTNTFGEGVLQFFDVHLLSPDPPMTPRFARDVNFAWFIAMTSSIVNPRSSTLRVAYHRTSPTSLRMSSCSARRKTPPRSRRTFFTFPATSPA